MGASDSSARVSTGISQNQSSNSIDRDALDRLPVFDQDYLTTMSRFLDADATGTNGVTLVVNGVEANGPGVTASAIQSVKINQNPYIQLSIPGQDVRELRSPQRAEHRNCTDRQTFFVATRYLTRATTLLRPSHPNSGHTMKAPSPALSVITKSRHSCWLSMKTMTINRHLLWRRVRTALLTQPFLIRRTTTSFQAEFFTTYSQGNQFWIGYSYEHKTVQNQGVGGTVLPSAGTNTLFFEHEVNVGQTYIFSPNLVNQLHFLVGHYDSQVHDLNENPQLIVSGAFTGGGAQAEYRKTEYHFDGTDIVTYTAGKQVIKFGVDVPDISRRAFNDFTNRQGTYSFASLSAYEGAQPFSYLVQSGQGHVRFLEATFAGIFEDDIRLSPNLSVAAGVRYYWQNYFHNIPHNFVPRLSFAYAPSATGKTVIRGGAGFFFDRTGPSPISDLLHFNGVPLNRFIVNSPSYPVTEPELAGVPTSVVVLVPRQRIPYTIQYGIGIEQQLNARSSLFVNYVGSRGIDLFRSRDVNAPPPPNYAARPNPNLGQERQLESKGYLKSNSLELGFRGRPARFFTGQARYALGKTYNNTSGITYFPANSYFPNADWSRSDNDQRNKFDLLGTLEAGKWFNFGTALSLYSGKPVNITTGNDENNDSLPLDRPVGVPRNAMHGPSYINLDLNLAHDFLLTKAGKEGPIATLSVNSFNVLNHPSDVTYIGVVTSPFFGHAVAAQPLRRMQLDL